MNKFQGKQNYNSKFKIKKTFHFLLFTFNSPLSGAGFSLIELLIVMTLIGIIGVIISQVFIMGFKIQAKSEIVKEIKQNGDFALSVMENMVRNSADINSGQCNISSNILTIINQDGYSTSFDCSEGAKIASISSYSGLYPTIVTPLTNNKVFISNCSFVIVCPTPPINPKYVFMSYTVNQSGADVTPTPGAYSSLEYQSTVSLRNYQ